jgi:hypothetical protein
LNICKEFGGKACARCESLVKVDLPLVKYMESNIKPVAEILSSIDRLCANVKEVSKTLQEHLANYHSMDSSTI